MIKSCASCRFFHGRITSYVTPPHRVGSPNETGECRRDPPSRGEDRATMREWRAVWADDWCGQWQSENGEIL